VVLTRPHRDVAEQAATQVRAFFERLHHAGAFGTRTMEESFFVICDHRINGVESSPSCDFQIIIGFAAVRRRRISQLPDRALGVGQQGCPRQPQSAELGTVQSGGIGLGG